MNKLKLRIGLWGGVGSGKTTFLTMLLQYLKEDSSSNWTVAIDAHSRAKFDEHISRIVEKRIFPHATFQAERAVLSHFTLIPKVKRRFSKAIDNIEIKLSFIDVAGEVYERFREGDITIVSGEDSDHLLYENVVDYLIDCDGIIFLLDPDRNSDKKRESYRSLLGSLFEQCRERFIQKSGSRGGLLPQFVSFCTTKVDTENLWNEGDSVKLAEDVMGIELFSVLQNYFYLDLDHSRNPSKNRCSFYGISSIGRYFDHEEQTYKEIVISEKDNQEMKENIEQNKNEAIKPLRETPSWNDGEVIEDPDEGWAEPPSINWADGQESTENNLFRLRSGYKLEPIGIFDPIEWLIQSIRSNPPLR